MTESATAMLTGQSKNGKENVYVLYLIPRNTTQTQVIFFKHEGELDTAILRAKKYCELTPNKFIRVTPFITNLEEQEKKFTV